MVTGLQRKLALRPLFPNDGLIGDANHLFAPVGGPHDEPTTTLAAEYGAG
jgi:hypothetical protein